MTIFGCGRGGITRVKSGGGGGAPFDPIDLADIVLHYHAADSSKSYNGAGQVSQINDRSANAIHATATAGNEPDDSIRTLNSKAILDFDGTEWLLTGTLSGLLTTSFHLFMVVIVDAYAASDQFFEAGASSDTDAGWQCRHSSSSNQVQLLLSDGTTPRDPLHSGAGNTMPIGSAFILEVFATGTSEFGIRINGMETLGAPANGGATTADPAGIMASSGGTAAMDGALAEVILCSAKQTGGTYSNIISYLESEWAL